MSDKNTRSIPKCVTCGAELHPERALKYDYCLAPACQEKNARPLTMVSIGMNKAADELMLLDDRTRDNLASGRYADQRRGLFGPAAPRQGGAVAGQQAVAKPDRRKRRPRQPEPPRKPEKLPWTASQERLALLYNQQGLKPDEIARKLGVTTWLATQIVLAARSRPKS